MYFLNLNGAALAGQSGFGWPITWDNKVNGGNSNVVVLGGALKTFQADYVRNRPTLVPNQAVIRAGFY